MDVEHDDWDLICTLAGSPEAGDPEALEMIGEFAREGVTYDVIIAMCREIVRLRVEVAELHRLLQLGAN